MSIVVNQYDHAVSTSTVTYIEDTLESVASDGDLIVAFVAVYPDSGNYTFAASHVDDDVTVNAYSLDKVSQATVSQYQMGTGCWSRQNSTTGNITVRFTPGITVWASIALYELAGAATSNAFDVGSTAWDVGTATVPSGNAITLSTEGFVAACLYYMCSGDETINAGTGYTLTGADGDCDHNTEGFEHKTGVAAGNITPTFSVPTTLPSVWIVTGVAYKAAAGGATVSVSETLVFTEALD